MLVYEKSESGKIAMPTEVYYNKNSFDKIKLLFNKVKDNGLISDETSFGDNKWIAIANKIRYSLIFKFNELALKRACSSSNIQISDEDFLLALKHYTLIYLQNNTPSHCSKILSRTRYFLDTLGFMTDIEKFNNEKSKIKTIHQVVNLNEYITFLEFMTGKPIHEELQIEVQLLEESIEYESTTRVLPTFKSIFEFGDIISSFVYNANEEELLKYGPLILWWYIGNRIPLRPSELILIERNCVHYANDKYYLDIKRNIGKGKGSNIKLINNFDTKETYAKETIQTDKKIYEAIHSYSNLVEKFLPEEKEREFLFSKKARDLYFIETQSSKNQINPHIFTAKNLSHLLEQFYIEIVEYKYNIKSCMRDYERNKKQKINYSEYIGSVHERLVLYDLRHLAIINLIMLGKEPLEVMKMAGHVQMSTTMGYYNHIEEFSKCFSITYAKHLKSLKDGVFESLSNGTPVNLNDMLESTAPTNKALQTWKQITTGQINKIEPKKVDGGLCSYEHNDFTPCFAVNGVHSICPYFISDDKETIEKELTHLNKSIDSTIDTIKYMVYNFDKISDFSQRYSVKIEELKTNIVNSSSVASKFLSIDDVTRVLKPLKLEE
ncbi:hypothetical protein [Clostridium perfringens]|uniref:hypothetical protein n=1 Tax=Clostridium perfringens TaxID=1502 RepID=UPI0023F9EC2D|nr:hypothetical protein [Clostridium perfringens]WEV18187.1 hypothetical protein PL323_11115 [Clostridium perfringens D]